MNFEQIRVSTSSGSLLSLPLQDKLPTQHNNHGTVYIAIEGHHIGIILLKIVFNFRSMKIMWIKEIN
jgi:hypothetical protein